jgi:hypothetical protein
MDFGRGLSYIRQDPDWLVKTLLGSVISFVPILNFASTGYMLDVIRNVYDERETPLPDWGDGFADRWVRGLIGTVIAFIYLLPVIVLGCAFGIAAGAAGSAADSDTASAGLGAVGLCLVPLIIVGSILLGLVAMVAQARYALTRQFGEAMRFGEVWAEFRSGVGRWLMVILMAIVAGIGFSLVAMLTCGLGYLLVFYIVLAQSHWIAQAYRQSTRGVGPITAAP